MAASNVGSGNPETPNGNTAATTATLNYAPLVAFGWSHPGTHPLVVLDGKRYNR
jgi:hypothetical protein